MPGRAASAVGTSARLLTCMMPSPILSIEHALNATVSRSNVSATATQARQRHDSSCWH
jgi:hypothetical protein